ncbi:alpha/beta hydrolase fold-domain-containing protein [Daldinia caldariorum]|uniref:alpha/beta hydrolase fold-domain-containing protein n=1 Tax=Daldinia caldariorum TaxID=326644 RepID=UPI0020088F2B|nr:alpha/beta hydrolase fold-domain-containing protein [Daldinia caldariorum]KAI1468255.1 alpha/beta hydrolase fold-domain-containing protein [Daldinia caldariorum]
MGRSLVLAQAFTALATVSSALTVTIPGAPPFKPGGAKLLQRRSAKSGNTTTDSISWGPCPDSFPSNITCATYTVPLDWEHPQANETIELGLVRIEARDKSNRIGNLFVNPGGPGGQASSLVASLATAPSAVDPQILDRFDVIGLDPRGVGLSTPVRCDAAAYNQRVTWFPETQGQFDALVAYNKNLAESCRAETGRLIDFVDTVSAARDHEAVRKALGGEKANFLGLSYGTQLFGQYAELFPEGVRALVLDGNLQHSQSESSNLLIESAAYEATLKNFFAWCAAAPDDDECPLRGQDVRAKYESVVAKARESPIPAPGCDDKTCRSNVTAEDIRFSVQPYLISPGSWPSLGKAIAAAADDDDATLISQQQPLATGDAYEDSLLFAGTAIACQDWTHASSSLAEVRAKAALGQTFTPLTGGACQSYKIQTSCVGWPAPLSNPPKPVSYDGAAKILMLQSTFDPSTSYAWGLGLHAEIGDRRSVLVTRNGTGHTSYLLGGEAAAAANAYLVNLTLPEPGTILQS